MTELSPPFGKPGVHSYNRARFVDVQPPQRSPAKLIRALLVAVGIAALGYYAYTLIDPVVYQSFANWAFEAQISGRKTATFPDWLRERTPFGFVAGKPSIAEQPSVRKPLTHEPVTPQQGEIMGRVEIQRLHLSAVVRQGVDDKTLSEAVGHVPSTALAGQAGNFAIAAHRDTLFRALKDIQKDDLISFQSTAGTFTYQVAATKIVRPTDVSVLRPDGGGLIAPDGVRRPAKLLTMITCYPFYYVGSAPKRFIVEARLVASKVD